MPISQGQGRGGQGGRGLTPRSQPALRSRSQGGPAPVSAPAASLPCDPVQRSKLGRTASAHGHTRREFRLLLFLSPRCIKSHFQVFLLHTNGD